MADNRTPPALAPPRGIVVAPAADGSIEGRRVPPSRELAPFVHHYWSVRWELRAPFTAETLPHPAARVVFEEGPDGWRAEIVGVKTVRFAKTLRGEGQWFGIQFRAAAFQPLLRAPMVGLTDRVVSAARVLGADSDAWARALGAAPTVAGRVECAEAFLRPLLRPLPAKIVELRDLVERIAADRSMLRVEAAAEALGVDPRGLQRRFRRYVGVSPKWVIQRFRMQEALVQLRRDHPPKLAALAASLGYADQAHFARDFRAMTGRSPGAFAR